MKREIFLPANPMLNFGIHFNSVCKLDDIPVLFSLVDIAYVWMNMRKIKSEDILNGNENFRRMMISKIEWQKEFDQISGKSTNESFLFYEGGRIETKSINYQWKIQHHFQSNYSLSSCTINHFSWYNVSVFYFDFCFAFSLSFIIRLFPFVHYFTR